MVARAAGGAVQLKNRHAVRGNAAENLESTSVDRIKVMEACNKPDDTSTFIVDCEQRVCVLGVPASNWQTVEPWENLKDRHQVTRRITCTASC